MKQRSIRAENNTVDKKTFKRVASFVTAMLMTVTCLPMSEIADSSKSLYTKLRTLQESLTAVAEDEAPVPEDETFVPYTDLDYAYTTEYENEGAVIKISNIEQLIWYSHAYCNAANGVAGYANHQNDTIVFAFGQDAIYKISSRNQSRQENYEPIGTEDVPFKGRILFDGSSASTFYLEAPLFGYICDNVKIAQRGDDNTPKRITIASATPAVYEPVLARHVCDDNTTASANWQLNYGWYTDDLGKVYTSMIGEIASGAEVNFDVTNNAVSGNAKANVLNAGTGDAAIICGKLDGKLTATYSGTNTDFYVTAEQGNAGGFVGSMGEGSELTLNISDNPMGTSRIKSDTGYAGGIVGQNNGGSVTVNYADSGNGYPIVQTITGNLGAGGVAGYYKPKTGAASFDASQFCFDVENNGVVDALKLTVTGTEAYAGGLFGKVENNGSNMMISGAANTVVVSNHCDVQEDVEGTAASAYGGIIGYYTAANTTDSLEINTLKTDMTSAFSNPAYGGGIGQINGASYVKFDTFSVNSASGVENATKFGGLTALTDYGYIYAKDITVGSAGTEIAGFTGGGLVGALGDGVLGMTGSIDLTKAKPTIAAENGKLVGVRDNAFIYAEDWTYTTNDDALDNVGSWGDTIVFGGSSPLTKASVMTADSTNPTTHVLTIPSVTPTAISNANDYTRASIQMQIDPSKNYFVAFENNAGRLADTTPFTLKGNITLTNSGVRGITRDKGTGVTYKGSVTGGSNTVTLDIKNVGGKPVYYHPYLGMFGITDGSSFTNVKFAGSILVDAAADGIYAGTAAGLARNSFTATNCETESGLNITINGAKNVYAGRLLGAGSQVLDSNNNFKSGITVDINGGTFDGTITGSNSSDSSCLGGIIGRIDHSKGNVSKNWTFSNTVTLKGTVSKTGAATQKIGGLVAEISGNNTGVLNLTSVRTDGLSVSGTAGTAMGGLLGFGWYCTDVNAIDVAIADTTSTYSNVYQTGNGSTAGVVHTASGHWLITKLDLTNITMTAANAGSVGMIVNKGFSGSKDGIYLEIPATTENVYYKLSFRGTPSLKSGGVFDEICAYSADSAANIMTNHQGIITISTTGLKMEDTAEDSLSYKNQTEEGAVKNPNSRYYYNLDLIDNDNDISASPEKQLMSWGLYQYACSNISSKYFTNFDLNQNSTYNMKGYSWYPVTLDTAVQISGTFKFYNKEFDACEAKKGKRTGIQNANIWSPLEADQHYMMQNGLFYDVKQNLTIGNLTLQGNIGAVDGNGTGALVYGTAYGYAKNDETHIVTISSTGGKIVLDGIKVWNLTYETEEENSETHEMETVTKQLAYAPLLINQASEYVTMNINDVAVSVDANTNLSPYVSNGTTIEAGTSLIGKAGNSNTSQYIRMNFTNIKLDGRDSEGNTIYDTARYGTTKSIFTRATLLEQLRFTTGGAGTYNYYYNDDWGTGTLHKVTYGKEVGYRTEGQHPNQERMYAGEVAAGSSRFTNPDNRSEDPYAVFDDFLSYVKTVNTKEDIEGTDATKNYYQLQVNMQAATKFDGCGTYNDPYQLKNASDVAKLSRWIRGDFKADEEVNIPAAGTTSTWCSDKTTPDHITYKCVGSTSFTAAGNNTISTTNMQKYLAGAYYIFPTGTADITLDSTTAADFWGIGTKDYGTQFRGVIIGNGISITNKTAYPFINYSSGCVVQDLSLTVNANITLAEATESYDYITGLLYNSNTNIKNYISDQGAYGAVIGVVAGGDNIIDKVQVAFGSSVITTNGKKAQFQPVGGYIGVVVNGGVVFKNMTGNKSGLASSNVSTSGSSNQSPPGKRTNMAADDNLAWLYVNPIIGRVVNGYAVTEASDYHPREADCTMKNGTKHYSITDIKKYQSLTTDDKLSVTKDKAVTIPNSQSFYVMSLIVNAGMGIQRNKGDANNIGTKTGYYDADKYQTVRRAEYSHVGEAASSADYLLAAKDTYSISTIQNYVPYLVANYTNTYTESGTAYYFAKQIANTNNNCTITLSDSSYDLPDGFKGIGSFYTSDHTMKITKFTGGGATISLNMNYNYYYSYNNATSVTTFDNNYQNIDDIGFGLFNNQRGTTNSATNRYYNFILTGSIKAECIDNKFTNGLEHIPYVGTMSGTTQSGTAGKTCIDLIKMVSIGALIGTSHSEQYIDSVALQNIKIEGIRYTGGLIGWIPGSKTTIKNTASISSLGIKVHGAGNTGGMIGRSYQGEITIDNNNATYSIEGIVSDCTSITGNDYNYGVGGFIGNCRGGGTSLIQIQNVIVGMVNQDSLTEVKCDDAEINAGGMIGILNNAKLNLSNCKIYNQSVSSQYTAAGLVGYIATLKNNSSTDNSTITGVVIECKDGLTGIINSDNNFAGGFIGACKYDACNVKITDSKISGYNISGSNYVGGILGLWSHVTTDGNTNAQKDTKLTTNNVIVEKCTISSNTTSGYSGGLVGYLSKKEKTDDSKYGAVDKPRYYYGYNILAKNLTITGKYKGSICGGTRNETYNLIKLVGFCRFDDQASPTIITETIGQGNYGKDSNNVTGYVIFSDYLGAQTNHSTVTDGTLALVSDAGKDPFVNINPKNTVASSQYLTGDGVSAFANSDKNSTEAFAKICKDILDNAEGSTSENKYAGYYETAASYADTPAEYTRFTNKISSFAKEMQNYKPANGVDFPVLIVDDASGVNTTALINEYIALLTNTTGYNFAENKSGVYNTFMSKCVYNQEGTVTTLSKTSSADNSSGNTDEACLKRASGQFYMIPTKTDTLEVNASHLAQFTLLDVRFLDPSDNTNVVYHLYVPIYVRKLLEYDFDVRVESGTNYYKNAISALNENNLIENMGVPVTLEFAYTYKRTPEEWISAANNGDNLLANFDKSLIFSNTTKGLTVTSDGSTYTPTPDFIGKKDDISMVLIDPQNNSKAYYLDKLSSSVFPSDENGASTLKLNSNFDGFVPVKFNDLMEVTVSDSVAGEKNLVETDDETSATLKVGNKYYKYKAEGQNGTHAVTNITFKDGGTELTEHYFLTIYTKYDETDATSPNPIVYHYTVGCPQTFGSDPFPSRLTTAGEKKASHLLMGYIYNNEVDIKSIKVGGLTSDHELTDTKNQMTTELEANIGFTQAGLDNVRTYLNQQNHPEIFESLLIKFDKRAGNSSDIGIKGVSDVTINSYSIGSDNVLSTSNSKTNSSYIELRNNTDLSGKMFGLTDTEGRVTIKATATVTFDNIAAQFYPESPSSNRTYVFGYSNISSSSDQTASSKVSAKDITDQNAYYTSVSEAAALTYDAVEITGKGLTPQLGINPIDPDNNSIFIQTLGAYDIEHFIGSAQSANYIRCDIQLKTIDDGYTDALVIADYIDKRTFSIMDETTPVSSIQGDNDTTWTFIYDKDDLELKGNIYQIPIDFAPLTGAAFEAGNTRKYANYGLFLKVSMLVNENDANPIAKSDPAADYVKWTNARITTEQVTP